MVLCDHNIVMAVLGDIICPECDEDGRVSYHICPDCDTEQIFLDDRCGLCGYHFLIDSEKVSIYKTLPNIRPCPTCYPRNNTYSHFNRYNECAGCGETCDQDLTWYYESTFDPSKSEEQNLKSLENIVESLLKSSKVP